MPLTKVRIKPERDDERPIKAYVARHHETYESPGQALLECREDRRPLKSGMPMIDGPWLMADGSSLMALAEVQVTSSARGEGRPPLCRTYEPRLLDSASPVRRFPGSPEAGKLAPSHSQGRHFRRAPRPRK
jgi:hypothetical protein